MARLTPEQAAFLFKHNIPLSMVFDATGMSQIDYRSSMKKSNKYFAFGVTPCSSAGHTLRARSGNCIQCKTANITFQLRDVKPADVYLAASRSKQIFKIGSSIEVDRRLENLCKVSYGNATDWLCIAKVRCKQAGQAEFKAQKALEHFRFVVPYTDAGREIEADELFACSYTAARSAFITATPEDERHGIWHHPAARDLCDFPDRPPPRPSPGRRA